VTVDRDLVKIASQAVAAGRAESLSGWVNLALTERVNKERRLLAMVAAVAAYEAEHGAITAEEMLAQERADRRSAVVVRGEQGRRAHRKQRRVR